ncbi:glycosyltransferase [Phenylobacterium sp. LjRoot225]|uniref:glycosyltransferase n=1 Tax=Phenylobacterium sp. LjRoot225 TaxID=3342285 RepID=UPI003ECD4203
MPQPYHEQHAEAVRRRGRRYLAEARPGRFGLLTTVYSGTDAALFRQTAGCLLSQTLAFDQWVILAHGPITDALDSALKELEADPRIQLLREPVNLGIMGGMRRCLAAAETEYVVPVDADDLLTLDALQVLSAEIDRQGSPAMLYSDEDLLVDGVPVHPYWRPDWDPVLNLASSYVWHLCCIRRDAAIEAGLYTDPGATWCHDWDTCFRLSRASTPVHVREVLYHWRQHPASTTNTTDGPSEGSRQSTRHLLERFVSQLPEPSLYVIDDFPIYRGAPEWYVVRRPHASPPVAVVGLNGPPAIAAAVPAARTVTLSPPGRSRPSGLIFWRRSPDATGLTVGDLSDALQTVEEPHVLLFGGGVVATGDAWWWEAVKLFECHPEVAVVCGDLTDGKRAVLRGIEVLDEAGRLARPTFRQAAGSAGPYALWLKPQCVDSAATDLCFVETALLGRTLAALARETPLVGLGMRLARQARAEGRVTAYSPLISAELAGPSVDGAAGEVGALAERLLDLNAVRQAAGARSQLARYA